MSEKTKRNWLIVGIVVILCAIGYFGAGSIVANKNHEAAVDSVMTTIVPVVPVDTVAVDSMVTVDSVSVQ